MSYPITVCIIAKNEEKHIEQCLGRLKSYGMEIVVADTGSCDKTKEIAKAYADKVVDYTWENDFSKARNFCARQASNDWILAIDCDEYVEKIDIETMFEHTKQYWNMYGVMEIRTLARSESGQKGYLITKEARLYNRRFYEFGGVINEKLEHRNMAFDPNPDNECFNIPAYVEHHGYDMPLNEIRIKQERKLSSLYKALDNTTDELELSGIRFLLGQAYIVTKNYSKAIENCKLALSLDDGFNDVLKQICAVEIAAACMKSGRESEAVRTLRRYKDIVLNEYFTAEHGFTILRNGISLEQLPDAVFTLASHNADEEIEYLITAYRVIIELYEMFNLHELAKPYKIKYTQLRKEDLLASGF